MERLDKIISNFGGLTRSTAREYLKKGRIQVNDSIIKDGSIKVSDNDIIRIDGKIINRTGLRYFMLNKPAGYISSTEDDVNDESPSVISLFKNENIKGLFPAGRLDKDTTGLIIITNDGELGHRLTSPAKRVEKAYIAEVKGILQDKDIEEFKKGFKFKDFTSKPAVLEIIKRDPDEGTSVAKVIISEGKYHQVKRMFLKVGCEVTRLKRISEGSLNLDDNLKPGEYRELTDEELKILYS